MVFPFLRLQMHFLFLFIFQNYHDKKQMTALAVYMPHGLRVYRRDSRQVFSKQDVFYTQT